MRHLNVIVISALMAVPFGVAMYQDSKKTDQDRLRELMGEDMPYAMEGYDSYDSAEARTRRAALDEELAGLGLDDFHDPVPTPDSLDESSIRDLIGVKGKVGPALSRLYLGMAVSEVSELPDSMVSWLEDNDGPFDARLSLEYTGANDELVSAIHVSFSDYGKALSAITEAWGHPTMSNDENAVWVAEGSNDVQERMVLQHSEYTNTTELVFSRSLSTQALLAPGEKKRLGFETKPILGSTAAAIKSAYPNAIVDSDLVVLELPGYQGSTYVTTEAEITFDEAGKANEIRLRLHYSLAPLLESVILGSLEQKYGPRIEETEAYDIEFGKPLKVGVSTDSDAMTLHFVK
jgi:hypothetical protein